MGKANASFRLSLSFTDGLKPELYKALFERLGADTGGWTSEIRTSKTENADDRTRHFLWKQGTQGWALALLNFRLAGKAGQGLWPYHGQASPSACNLIEKQEWLKSGFGSDPNSDRQFSEQIFKVHKDIDSGTTTFQINSKLLPPTSVKFFVGNSAKELPPEKIRKLVAKIESDWVPHRTRDAKPRFTSRQQESPGFPEAENFVSALHEYARSIRMVKTVWQVDEAVDLLEFYYPCRLLVKGITVDVSCSDELPGRQVVIEGVAGHGKSIFLRYLCSQEVARKRAIPLFLELSRVAKDQPLVPLLTSLLITLPIKATVDQFANFAGGDHLSLFLDGFDEVRDDSVEFVCRQIEDLIITYPQLRVFVTSRPDSQLKYSRLFQTVSMAPLAPADVEKLVYKLQPDTENAKELVDALHTDTGNVFDLLVTPLMATLLVQTYKASRFIPRTISDFYEELFTTLLRRHDGTKPGFRRKRLCKLSDSDYRRVFDSICFTIRFSTQYGLKFDRESIDRIADKSLRSFRYQVNGADYIDDICSITCLIVKDGLVYRFIHKTVLEYFTASYIKREFSPIAAEKFYRECAHRINIWLRFNKELEFLGDIDRTRKLRVWLLDEVLDILGATNDRIFNQEERPDVPNGLRNLLEVARIEIWGTPGKRQGLERVFIPHLGGVGEVSLEVAIGVMRSHKGDIDTDLAKPILSALELEQGTSQPKWFPSLSTTSGARESPWNGRSGNAELDDLHKRWVANVWDMLWSQCKLAADEVVRTEPNDALALLKYLGAQLNPEEEEERMRLQSFLSVRPGRRGAR